MKKILLAGAGLLFISITNAQFYAQGGFNLANITKTSNGYTESNNLLPSFQAGFLFRPGLSDEFDIETGLLFTGKGSKAETYFNGGKDYVKSRFNPYYIEMPVNAVLKFPLSKSTGIFFTGGPYAAIGIGGKATRDTRIGPLTSNESSSIQFSNDDPFTSEQDDAAYNKLKRFDFGLNFGGGLMLNHILLRANYGLGLTKINSTESSNNADDKNKYRVISFSVAIPLGK